MHTNEQKEEEDDIRKFKCKIQGDVCVCFSKYKAYRLWFQFFMTVLDTNHSNWMNDTVLLLLLIIDLFCYVFLW